MVKFLVAVLLVISCCAAASTAQAPTAPDHTASGRLINGRFWSILGKFEKIEWVAGYEEGITVATARANVTDEGKVSDTPCGARMNQLYASYGSNLTAGELAAGIDRFYQETPENAPVAVAAALHYVVLKSQGAQQSELDELASLLRREASAAPAKKQ